MLRFLAAFAILGLAAALTQELLDEEWTQFKAAYGKTYAPKEEAMRRKIWNDNLNYIQKHNLEADRNVHSFRVGMNAYGDMTSEEFVSVMNGYKQNDNQDKKGRTTFLPPSNIGDLPTTVDWRTKGYVTDVKNQGQCGSCWAFSTTGSLEGQHFKKYGQLISMSEQNLVDCSKKQGNMGCGGGLMDQAFTYIKVNDGIDTEASYPYTAQDGTCHFTRANVAANDTGFVDIPSGNEDALKTAVATVGPISVAIDASHPSFQLYKSGVYYDFFCSSKRLDHGVLAVGYGTDGSKDYWLVKNSWGASWGDKGYLKMSRNRRNNCGIATSASYPTV
ncbi:hypothetical protein LOTGIDRAFT_204652 [Lottia gigantea]|uniref:Cathepsin L n=1 Tax=Lottia gigantea TaxID=225164 RepID=V4B8K7_LOTGI|nr:hypothetical protein LOTGIDRAFT_204652 [Lottia gigantea]ESO85089.1 hypothetical protein LOTGIDRAFT_204652 [Lottia gigantea]